MKLRLIAGLLALAFLVGVFLPVRADARQDEGAGEAPRTCSLKITPTGTFQGVEFSSVPMTRDDPYIASTNHYKNDAATVVSDDRKWLWANGGGTFNCWRLSFLYWFVDGQSLVPPSDGTMLPGPDEESGSGNPPPSGTGGSTYEWPTGASSGGGTVVCEVTDWYQGSVYVETEINYCWVRYF